jgi:hypothetical protein
MALALGVGLGCGAAVDVDLSVDHQFRRRAHGMRSIQPVGCKVVPTWP